MDNSPPFRIYLVEDEANLNRLLVSYLEKEGWQVRAFLTGEEARAAIPHRPDLWILDIMLPDTDGYQLITEIKADSPQLPVIFISARDADLDRVIGLEKGSDDYLPKPFLPRELVIRTRKLLERVYLNKNIKPSKTIILTPYSVDPEKRSAEQNGSRIDLTSKELDLLLLFATNPGRALSRQQILDHVWGREYVGTDRAVDDLVKRLRRKMPSLRVETIYGYGYRLV